MITGPNMGGKSTYMRQTALITIMARAGSFVPAKSAIIGDVDRIFTRIGASDDLVSGRSTFMVEMEEASSILNNATAKSLVLMDEIGRGTSAIEGASLAYAIAVYLSSKLGCLSLFSTHYSEICSLEGKYPQIRNLCFKAKETGGKIVFLYHVSAGAISHSYAIEVGRLAGLPDEVISMATHAIKNSDQNTKDSAKVNVELDAEINECPLPQDVSIEKCPESDPKINELVQRLEALDINSLTPLAALNTLSQLKESLKQ